MSLITYENRVPFGMFPAVVVLALSSWGCATLPKTGVAASGEPLDVRTEDEQQLYSSKTKVGEVQNRNSLGRVTSTSDVYKSEVKSMTITHWQLYQGETKLDDQDFFRIAGDTKTADEIASERSTAVIMNRLGIGVIALGVLVTAAGFILPQVLSKKDQYGNIIDPPAYAPYVRYGGIAVIGIGGALTGTGYGVAKKEHPGGDLEKAREAARKYNETLKKPEPNPDSSSETPPSTDE